MLAAVNACTSSTNSTNSDLPKSSEPGSSVTNASDVSEAAGGTNAWAAGVQQTSGASGGVAGYPDWIIADANNREPNELGRIPVLEYHLIVPEETGVYTRTPERLRQDLEELRRRGYVPMNMSDVADGKLQALPKGMSPVVLVFDDASPSHFRYLEEGDSLVIDPTTAVGVLESFSSEFPDWPRKAVFCVLPAAQAGRSFFGDKGIEGQKTEWRFRKLQFLHSQGYEICNHTLYHARLDRAGDRVEEFIARGDMAIDSALPGYRVRTFALPLGMWPAQRDRAWHGSWADPRSGRTVTYNYDIVLEVTGAPNESPYDPAYDPRSFNRQIMYRNALEVTLNNLDKPGPKGRYVSDGDSTAVTRKDY